MTYECGECYKSEKNCKCDKESECPTCDKSYNDNELLELDGISNTACPHCDACVHTMNRYLDCDSVHYDDCEDDCEEHCHRYGDQCELVICCACGESE